MEEIIERLVPLAIALRDELGRILGQPEGSEPLFQRKLEAVRDVMIREALDGTVNLNSEQAVDPLAQATVCAMLMAWSRYCAANGGPRGFRIDAVPSMLPDGSFIKSICTGVIEGLPGGARSRILAPIERAFNLARMPSGPPGFDGMANAFYSDFLGRYDKATKKARGVVYTPEPVVEFIVRGIDHLLEARFGVEGGIVGAAVDFIDPAAGTMAFPAALLWLGHEKLTRTDVAKHANPGGHGAARDARFDDWFHSRFTREGVGPGAVSGFEVLPAPCLLGAARLLALADRLGATVDHGADKVRAYCKNALAGPPVTIKDPGRAPVHPGVTVVMGNPPYNISSRDASAWINGLVREYVTADAMRREPGKPAARKITGMKSSKDDYWKFIRYAQWAVTEAGSTRGIVAFITNNFYIDGKIARGMRKELRRHFDEIWVVDLHGDWKKAIPRRAGAVEDQNIFDVGCGIAILFAMRLGRGKPERAKADDGLGCAVKYHEVWGDARLKLEYLSSTRLADIPFMDVGSNLDWEFTPEIQNDRDYDLYPYMCDIFEEKAVGIVSGADNLLSSADKGRLVEKLDFFFDKGFLDALSPVEYVTRGSTRVPGKAFSAGDIAFADNRDWRIDVALARGNAAGAKAAIIEWMWRGFDRRPFSYYPPLMKRGTDQYKVMQYLLPGQDNVALVVNSQSRGKAVGLGSSTFITDVPVEHMCNEGASGMESYVFPLRVNATGRQGTHGKPMPADHPNVAVGFLESLGFWERPGAEAAEAVFYYIYGVLFAPAYRARFAGLLARDFPRVPFPRDKGAFDSMSGLGRQLAAIHLMRDGGTRDLHRWRTTRDEGSCPAGPVRVGKHCWISEDGEVGDLWFDTEPTRAGRAAARKPACGAFAIRRVPVAVRQFEIGGINQVDQWLGSRRYSAGPGKGRLARGLDDEELAHFIRTLNAIADTIAMRPSLDAAYERAVTSAREG